MSKYLLSLAVLIFIACGGSSSSSSSTEIISHNSFSYNIITSPITGKKWLDRNLGASEVCTKSRDDVSEGFTDATYTTSQEDCFGDYYQWGRLTDGHEKSGSSITDTRAIVITLVGIDFIKNTSSPYDWVETTSQDSNNIDNIGNLRNTQWSKTDGTSVCPIGFRVPTHTELESETIADSIQDSDVNNNGNIEVTSSDTAFKNFLKLPSAGFRYNYSGSMYYQGSYGSVWSSSANGSDSRYVYFDSSNTGWYNGYRAYGLSVRCVKD